jgi:hypothetical protein
MRAAGNRTDDPREVGVRDVRLLVEHEGLLSACDPDVRARSAPNHESVTFQLHDELSTSHGEENGSIRERRNGPKGV